MRPIVTWLLHFYKFLAKDFVNCLYLRRVFNPDAAIRGKNVNITPPRSIKYIGKRSISTRVVQHLQLKCRLYCYVSRHGLKSNFSHFCGSISRASILHPPPPMMRLPFIATIVSRVVVVLGPSVGHFPGLFYSVLLLAVQSVAFNQLLPPPQPPCCAIHVSPFCLRPPPMMHLLGETRPGLLYVPPCGSFSGAFVLPPFPPPLHNASPLHCNTCL